MPRVRRPIRLPARRYEKPAATAGTGGHQLPGRSRDSPGSSSMSGWNIADLLGVVAEEVGDAPAVVQGDRRLSWREFDARTEALATQLIAAGLRRQDKVVQYLRNCPEYVESFAAALKASLVPVNTNYRYGPDELTYLWQNADAAAVVFAGSFGPTIERMRGAVPSVRLWLWVDDGSDECPRWAMPYEAAMSAPAMAQRSVKRDGDDLVLLYTGGTTGLPKGVMWRQDDLVVLLGNAANARYPDRPDLAFARERVAAAGRRHLPAAPLMHGAGVLTCLPVMMRGGTVVLLEGASFRAEELLDTVERERVNSVGWVGDAFARPVLEALDREPERWDLSSWSIVTSGGVLFSEEVKRGLLRHLPSLLIADVYGSSEAIAAARSITTAKSAQVRRSFAVGGAVAVLDPEDRPVVPGSGQVGRVAYAGRSPVGYYKDESKSAETFRSVGGQRFVMTGDSATVDTDGAIVLLGRGSSCINTGGEKVYPEEVEEVLKRHPSVADAVVLGLSDERFGESVAAVVQLVAGAQLDLTRLQDHVRDHLAGYKVPRRIAVAQVVRGPSGKVDLAAARRSLAKDAAAL